MNIAATAPGSQFNYVVAGFGFVAGVGGPGGVTPAVSTALPNGGNAVVNFLPALNNASLFVDQINAAGVVNNSANLTLFADTGTADSVLGLFTNTAVLTDESAAGDFAANQLAGGLANLGTINETTTNLVIASDKNVSSTGVLNMPAGSGLAVLAANIDIEGSVTTGTLASQTPISSSNPLTFVALQTLGAGGKVATPGTPQTGGVVDIATSLFSNGSVAPPAPFLAPENTSVEANAIRVLSGGITTTTSAADPDITLAPGTNAAGVPDPFYGLSGLGYTFSLFPGTSITSNASAGAITVTNPNGGTMFANSSGLNLDGTSFAPTINVTANNINSNNGLNGGFVVPNGGTLNLTFFGNVNNPNHFTAFLNNYVPVTVGANGTKAGTATITLAGPNYTNSMDQFVNLLVQGPGSLAANVQLADGSGAQTAPVGLGSFSPITPYANNHLVVTATGNIGLSPGNGGATFYWPGLVYLTAGATASNPTAAPNSTASITLGNTTTKTTVNLTNFIPADLTTKDVGGSTGGGGVHYLTNNLILIPPGAGGAAGVTTISNNSWVNFLNASIASSFQGAAPNQFQGGVVQSNGQVKIVNPLAAADFQPK